MATRDCMLKNAVWEVPKTAFRLNNSLERPTEFRKALISMTAVYYKRIQTKMGQGMIHIGQSQKIHC